MFFITEDRFDAPVLGHNLRIKSEDCPLPKTESVAKIQALMPYKFALLDDTNEFYYIGYYDGLHGTHETAFAPLTWAKKYTMCTKLAIYKEETKKWAVLPKDYNLAKLNNFSAGVPA